MELEKRLANHYKRWNIKYDLDEDYRKFKHRLIEILNNTLSSHLFIDTRFSQILDFHEGRKPKIRRNDGDSIQTFLEATEKLDIVDLGDAIQKYQKKMQRLQECGPLTQKKRFGDTTMYASIDACQSSVEIATVIQFIFWALEDSSDETHNLTHELIAKIRKLSTLTPSVGFQLQRKKSKVIVYPQGDDFLDQGIINYVLSGLEDFPEAAKPFEHALEIYQIGQLSQYRNLLDDLRLSLETLLKKVLNNKKSLENQEQELLRWLKGKQLHQQIVNLYKQLLFGPYRIYQNDAVKHGENYSLDEVEFAIYLTGNFMRFILRLHGE